jgi:hypothetical protein
MKANCAEITCSVQVNDGPQTKTGAVLRQDACGAIIEIPRPETDCTGVPPADLLGVQPIVTSSSIMLCSPPLTQNSLEKDDAETTG